AETSTRSSHRSRRRRRRVLRQDRRRHTRFALATWAFALRCAVGCDECIGSRGEPLLEAVIPSQGAKRRSRGIAVVLAEWACIWTAAIPRLATLARNDSNDRRRPGRMALYREEPSFRAKARSA